MKHTLMFLTLALSLNLSAEERGFVSIFNGKDLSGWTQKGGKAQYTVKDGEIIGAAVPSTPNSFLCTQKIYADFILEYEYKCDNRLNSGVQIRSNAYEEDVTKKLDNGKTKKFPAGRVHGYQVEIDPNKARPHVECRHLR